MFILFKKVKWASYRIAFIVFIVVYSLTGGLLGYITGPVISVCFFKEFSFFKYRRYFIPIAQCFWHMIYRWLADKNYRTMSSLPLTSPPASSPDTSLVQIADQWKSGALDCHTCSKCCWALGCPLLSEGGKCAAYNSFYWRYFNCGRFPSAEQQIRYYGCPKWELTSPSNVAANVGVCKEDYA